MWQRKFPKSEPRPFPYFRLIIFFHFQLLSSHKYKSPALQHKVMHIDEHFYSLFFQGAHVLVLNKNLGLDFAQDNTPVKRCKLQSYGIIDDLLEREIDFEVVIYFKCFDDLIEYRHKIEVIQNFMALLKLELLFRCPSPQERSTRCCATDYKFMVLQTYLLVQKFFLYFLHLPLIFSPSFLLSLSLPFILSLSLYSLSLLGKGPTHIYFGYLVHIYVQKSFIQGSGNKHICISLFP